MKKTLLTLFILSSSLLAFSQGSWSPRASLPDSARAYGIGFSIGNYGYVGLGTHNSHVNYPCLDDFWQFNPSTNLWTQKANFPGKARLCPATFVIGHYAYVVTGQENDSSPPRYTTECWRYDANNNTWTQKANFPSSARAYDVGFAIGGKGYVGTGSQYDFDYRKDFWAYDTATNSWTKIADLPPATARFSASGFAANGKGYVCFGYDSSKGVQNDIWEYDPGTNAWTQKTNCPGPPQCCVSGFVINNKIYIGLGTNDVGKTYNQFWQYNTSIDTWVSVSYFPQPSRTLGTAFSIADTGYAGFGIDSASLYFNDLFKFYVDSTLGIASAFNIAEVNIYPNPVSQTLFINFSKQFIRPATLSIMDIAGRIVVSEQLSVISNQIAVDVSSLSSGMYFINIKNQDLYATQKFIKQ